MARKKRSISTAGATLAPTAPKTQYQDTFQHDFGAKVEDFSKKFEGHKKNILYGIAALAVLGAIVGIFYIWNSRSNAAAQTALGKAIETSMATVGGMPPPAGSNLKSFATIGQRAEAAIGEFQEVADKFGGSVGEKAKYFVAVNKLVLDRPTAISELEAMSKSNDNVGNLSKFALAQTRVEDGRLDDAAALYKELSDLKDPVVALDTVNLELAKIYEKQDKKQDAVDLLFNLVKTASEAKDSDGKAVPLTPSAQNAKDMLERLDPEKAKELPAPTLDPALGSLPFGNE